MSHTLLSTIAGPVEHRLEIKRSVFLTQLTPVESVEEADNVVAAARKLYWDAAHNCVALVVGPYGERQRSNDDGEPAGTAGAPMLEVLRHRGVTDLVAVVTRWFGGTLLGAGGLVRAYGGAVSAALDQAVLVDRVRLTQVIMRAPHADAGRLLAYLHQWVDENSAVLDEPTYADTAQLGVWVAPEKVSTLQADIAGQTAGSVIAEVGGTEIVDRPRR